MEFSGIDHGKAFDFGRASQDYAKYRDIYPPSFYHKLREIGIGLPGQHVLDLGTGTGVLPRAMAPNGVQFTGVDISPNQIEMARQLSQGLSIAYHLCPVEEIDFPANTFDAATACQCFWYFNRSALLPKLHQSLKPGGLFGILSMAWIPRKSPILQQGEALVLKYNPKWTGGNWKEKKWFYPPRPRWAKPLFQLAYRVNYTEDIPFTRAAWHGRMLTCRGVGSSSLPEKTIAAFEKEHLQFLETVPEEFTIPHQIIMLVLKKI